MAEINQEPGVSAQAASDEMQRRNLEIIDELIDEVMQQPEFVKALKMIPPNPTVIIKNLPYDLDLTELEDKLNKLDNGQLQYKSYCPHKDQNGNFRGMVFINYRNISDAMKAHKELSELEIGGRKARIEYRRLKPGEKPPKDEPEKPARAAKPRRSSEANWRLMRSIVPTKEELVIEETVEEEDLDLTSTRKLKKEPRKGVSYQICVTKYINDLKEFKKKDDSQGTEYVFPADLTSFQRCAAHEAAKTLGLPHKTFAHDEKGRCVHVIKDPDGEFLGERVWVEKKAYVVNLTPDEMTGLEQKLKDFKDQPDSEGLDLEFESFLSSAQRKYIHKIAERLGLGHKVLVKDESRVLTCTKDPEKTALWKEEWSQKEASFTEKKKDDVIEDDNDDTDAVKAGRRRSKRLPTEEQDKEKKPAHSPLSAEEASKYRWTMPRSLQKEGKGESITVSRIIPRYTPPRQPRGPDGTRGFHCRTQTIDISQRKDNENEADSPPTELVSNETPEEAVGGTESLNPATTETAAGAATEEAVRPVQE
eukprot:Plantae.Rhodophyta-Purpureofilum_apyrenoidigerum.ctg15541.p1 GENE.Plantae.Rhodophyta-Purpureofilum_apyrenoidigerum.ctg15541~~Plantae.Rhodophyta-Purpureofilum_apyrenoidigerum.ctg15541.p1  ORF type:complete len:534 (-),score=109.57 Plantae.Rhodophyta-Purpureofilum_apyrenoidigerum.ctg15541:157-1758(-)